MKNILGLFLLALISFGCDNPEKSKTTTKLPPDEEKFIVEVIFRDSSGFVPLKFNENCKNSFDGEACQNDAKNIRNEVISKIKEIDSSIQLDSTQINVYLEVSAYLDNLNAEQYQKLEENADLQHYSMSFPFEIQARRPIMQTEYIEHARRPIMQEQLKYDSNSKTSLMIMEIGGGLPGSSPTTNKIWIVDSGIDSLHQDLSFGSEEANLSRDYSPGGNNPFKDEFGHGTFLAGAIGGKASDDPIFANGYGINGVFPSAKMVSIKIFNQEGKTNSGKVKLALSYVRDNSNSGDIVNLSWGFEISVGDCEANPYKNIYELIEELAAKGVYVVMSAGNDPKESLTNFPGCIDLATSSSFAKSKVFTIGSIEVPVSGTYYYSFFSNYGRPSVDYLAPGEDVFTTAPEGKYVLVSGTSMSAAIFSGILYQNPDVDTLAIIKRGADNGGADPDYPIAKVGN